MREREVMEATTRDGGRDATTVCLSSGMVRRLTAEAEAQIWRERERGRGRNDGAAEAHGGCVLCIIHFHPLIAT